MATLKLTRQQAQDLAYDEAGEGQGLTVELNEMVDTLRWSSVHRLIVKDGAGKLWEASYTRGLTENQDERPFEDQAEVEFREVEKVPVTSYEYRPAKSEVVR
jgi:hypothetical protein